MAAVLMTGTCCECCALMVANGDDSGCRDYYGHDHPAPEVNDRMTRQLDEIDPTKPADIPWSAWLVISGDEDEVIMGCDLCGADGFMNGWEWSIVR